MTLMQRSHDWVELDLGEINPAKHESSKGVVMSSSLAPHHVPSAFKTEVTDTYVCLLFRYDSLFDEKTHEITINKMDGASICMGSVSKQIKYIKISKELLERVQRNQYQPIRSALEDVTKEHPRWGTFTAASNTLGKYARKIDQGFDLYAY